MVEKLLNGFGEEWVRLFGSVEKVELDDFVE
jgi:hypothetical protein